MDFIIWITNGWSKKGEYTYMNIFEVLLSVLAFTVYYFVIGKVFRRVDEILEKKLSKKVYDAIMVAIFILTYVLAIYVVFCK